MQKKWMKIHSGNVREVVKFFTDTLINQSMSVDFQDEKGSKGIIRSASLTITDKENPLNFSLEGEEFSFSFFWHPRGFLVLNNDISPSVQFDGKNRITITYVRMGQPIMVVIHLHH